MIYIYNNKSNINKSILYIIFEQNRNFKEIKIKIDIK